jgi:hypothetical protein
MTLLATSSKVLYTGNGSNKNFPIPFHYNADTEVVVYLRDESVSPPTETLKTNPTHYSISGGNVVMVTAPTAQQKLLIKRVLPLDQEASYSASGAFPAATHEGVLDRIVMMLQQHEEMLGRVPQLPITLNQSVALPEPVTNSVLGWDSHGNLINTPNPLAVDDIVPEVADTGSVGTGAKPFHEVNATTLKGALTGNVTGNVSGSAGSFTGNLAGDVTGPQGTTAVATVGTSSAANVHSAELAANAATNLNTAGTIVKRDGSGNFSAGTISAALSGNATTAGTATDFSGNLAGDVTGTQGTTAISGLARSKLASGTNYRILANGAAGAMSENAAVTGNRAVASDANGQLVASATTATELGYVSGVTSAIQTQLTNIAAGAGLTALTGDVTAAGIGTQAATVAAVGGSTAANVHTAEALVNGAQSGSKVLASPSGGGSGAPAFRALAATDIPANIIANSSLAQMATNTIKGNNTGGTANAADLTAAQARALIAKAPTSSTAAIASHGGAFSANATGTYTTPAGVLYIRVRMVGGGGGGAAAGSSGSPTVGGAGAESQFYVQGQSATSLLRALGGGGGSAGSGGGGGNPGAGGTSALGSGPLGVAFTGGSGSWGANTTLSTGQSGGAGGVSPFGGAGGGAGSGQGGVAAATNSGSGGGGAGGGVSFSGGGGGGAGGYVDALITSPSAAYTYTVGAKGSAGTGGTIAGSIGGEGLIIVDEFYA